MRRRGERAETDANGNSKQAGCLRA